MKIIDIEIATPPKENYFHNYDLHEMIHGNDWEKVFIKKNWSKDYPLESNGFESRFLTKTPIISNDDTMITSFDLMMKSSKKLLKRDPKLKKNISLVLSITTTSHKYTTSLASLACGQLNLSCASLEMKAGCASGLYALELARTHLETNNGYVLILSAETLSKIANRKFIYSVGDAGVAILLGKTKRNSFLKKKFETRGKFASQMGIKQNLPIPDGRVITDDFEFQSSDGLDSNFLQAWKEFPKNFLKESKLNSSEIQFFISNQPNKRFIDAAIHSCELNLKFQSSVLKKFSNCGQTGFFLTLAEMYKESNWKSGDLAFLCGIGGGMNLASIIWSL
ncbi:MAG: 3-oxoacyl-[acyl-carrier-protein] synthase III C-terminal domain-containing protein [Leptospiraceae bacterium]|nr:3-oxoacyl-[acyl-carrier-protein] synthase III C-terminal domain-containing protein [Leptospiraceae bacterium]